VAIEIDWLGGNCPVQAMGKIDGEPFYFRARGETWSLSIGSEEEDSGKTGVHGRDVVGSPSREYEEDYGDGPYDAGWMKEDVARQMIEKAAKIRRDSQGALPTDFFGQVLIPPPHGSSSSKNFIGSGDDF